MLGFVTSPGTQSSYPLPLRLHRSVRLSSMCWGGTVERTKTYEATKRLRGLPFEPPA